MLLREEVQELQNTDMLDCEGFGQGARGKQKTEFRIQYSSVWSARVLEWLERTAEMKIRFFFTHRSSSGNGSRRTMNMPSSIRFMPRKKNSIWSLANLRRVERLKKSGRMKPAGLESHSMRDPAKTGIYS